MTAVVVIGGGLAGSLLALELRQRDLPVVLVDCGNLQPGATFLSYGAVAAWAAPPTPLGRLMRQAPKRWRELGERHGVLSWRRRWLKLHGDGGMGWLSGLPLPCGQVEAVGFASELPAVLERAGVQRRQARVARLEPRGDQWALTLAGGDAQEDSGLVVPAVVLAAGAYSRDLWSALSPNLWVSWAGVIELESWPPGYRRGQLVLPGRFQRLAVERGAAQLEQESWVVDAGLVPWGDGALVGQISLVRPCPLTGEQPDPALMEQRLRAGLQRFDPTLSRASGTYRQAPVAFSTDSQPLVGPVHDAPGLWQFTGFSAAFAQVPVLAPGVALAIAKAWQYR